MAPSEHVAQVLGLWPRAFEGLHASASDSWGDVTTRSVDTKPFISYPVGGLIDIYIVQLLVGGFKC